MSATVLNLSFYQSYMNSWHAAQSSRSKEEETAHTFASTPSNSGDAASHASASKFSAGTHHFKCTSGASGVGSQSNSPGPVLLDKARFKSRLLDLLSECLPFEHTARITMLMSVRLDDRPEGLNFDIAEELTRPGCRTVAPTVVAAAVGGSKRKSQAPQRMVPTGEDSFALAPPTPAVPAAVTTAAADVSSSFNADLSDESQPLNLSSRHGSPAASASTPVKQPTAFQQNNPELIAFPFGVPLVVAKPQLQLQHQSHQLSPLQNTQQPQQQQQQQQQQEAAVKAEAASNAAAAAAAAALVASAKQQQQPQSAAKVQIPQLQNPRVATGRSRRPGNRSFPCNQCGQVFQSLAGLSKHTFTMHKVYKCTFCGANFTQRSNLQRHSLKHVGFKPFECRCCRKSYYRKDHLVRHIEVTHPGHDPKLSIDTRLSSAECLQYLEKKHETRDYTSLSGVVPSAAAAAAAAAEGAVLVASAQGSERGADEFDEDLMMMDDEEELEETGGCDAELEEGLNDEAAIEAEGAELGEEFGDEGEDEEIDVGRDEHHLQTAESGIDVLTTE